jgi:ribosome-associated heat shock protein Hsp15
MTDRIRIDKWLWHARFYKTRPLAQAAAASGRIMACGIRRGPAKEAQALYEILTDSTLDP